MRLHDIARPNVKFLSYALRSLLSEILTLLWTLGVIKQAEETTALELPLEPESEATALEPPLVPESEATAPEPP